MEKSAEAFRTISEVSELLQTPAHVLRFWESRFSQVKPVKRAGGRRYYRPADLALLGGIKRLLHDDGMTIRGVQKVLREQGVRHVAALSPVDLDAEGDADQPAPMAVIEDTPAPEDSATIHSFPAAERPVEPAAEPTGDHWPESPPPDTAGPGDALLPDPDDSPEEEAAEAPQMYDTPATTGDMPPPAATLLRAMDALRARDKRDELTSVYRRLRELRERVASGDTTGRD
jgi:DNA-binding transcriptional MerR regulator